MDVDKRGPLIRAGFLHFMTQGKSEAFCPGWILVIIGLPRLKDSERVTPVGSFNSSTPKRRFNVPSSVVVDVRLLCQQYEPLSTRLRFEWPWLVISTHHP
uniref:Uncharacterized protein n=1 Tax=Panagrellus redivivus TaxID=6233 RepID=A0A7E4W413_PANRE